MSEYQMETRRRSRSKTPFLRSNCDHESCEHAGEDGHTHHHHHHQKKKTPNVQTIIEESTEVSSTPSKAAAAAQKVKTSDYSSEDTSPENKKGKLSNSEQQTKKHNAASSSSLSTTTTTTTIITKTTKKHGANLLQGSTSTPKNKAESGAQYLHESFAAQFGGDGGSGSTSNHRAKEITQNHLNAEREQHKTITKSSKMTQNSSKNRSFGRFFGNNSSYQQQEQSGNINEADISDHIAYLEYKKAGEYWKTTPKTDYTYSELSPDRRILAPGIVAMPNMSRRSLENHHERINFMIDRNPAEEEFIRRRYETSRFSQNQREAHKLTYDSGDEVDQFDRYTKKQTSYNNGGHYDQHSDSSWFARFITTIVTTITTVWTNVTGGNAQDDSALYYTRVDQEQRGFFGSIAHGISSAFMGLFRYLYLGISSILYLDTWLLQSSNPDNKGKKRFLLFLLVLLPLLLLAGLFYYLHPEESFPPKSFSQYTYTLPDLPKIDIRSYMPEEINYEAIKSQTYNRLEDFRDWTHDYFLYLKSISQNVVNEGRTLFQREEHFERV